MNNHEFIVSKQVQWALNRGLHLIGSEDKRGIPAYTSKMDENLFHPLIPSVKKSFSEGNGGEIIGSPEKPAKMQAVHSSSALGVNVFQYWEEIDQVSVIAAACGFCEKGNMCSDKIVFEEKFTANIPNHIPPNIDVVIHNNNKSKYKYFAIECKFTEAYNSRGHGGLAEAYFEDSSFWADIPHLYDFAQTISPTDDQFSYLHPAQLVKHILGLKNNIGKNHFKLLYLWYDALGKEGAKHREEIEYFSEITTKDCVSFISLTYQELITRLARDNRKEQSEYITYLTERYL